LDGGRGVSIELELPNICQTYDEDVGDYEAENTTWPWVSCLRIGDRSYTAGSDSSIEDGELVNEITAILEPMWVPAWPGVMRRYIDVAMWFANAWHAWSAAFEVDGSKLETIECHLQPSSLPDVEPFKSPVGPPKSSRPSERLTESAAVIVPD